MGIRKEVGAFVDRAAYVAKAVHALHRGKTVLNATIQEGFVERGAIDLHKESPRVTEAIELFIENERAKGDLRDQVLETLRTLSPAELAAVLEIQDTRIMQNLRGGQEQ